MISLHPVRDFLRQSVLAGLDFAAALILMLSALLAPWIAPADPAAQNLPARLEFPSRAHWIVPDELGPRHPVAHPLRRADLTPRLHLVVCGAAPSA